MQQESGGGASEDDGLIGQSTATSAHRDDASDRDKAAHSTALVPTSTGNE